MNYRFLTYTETKRYADLLAIYKHEILHCNSRCYTLIIDGDDLKFIGLLIADLKDCGFVISDFRWECPVELHFRIALCAQRFYN